MKKIIGDFGFMEQLDEKLHIKLLNFKQEQWIKWVEERKPFSVLFELTPKCNLDCVHCYLKNVHCSKQLGYEEIVQILDLLYEKGILFLVMTGGEVLIRKDFLKIYMYAKKKGFLIEIFSNGVLFNDEIISVLQEFPPLYIDITLYGANEQTYRKMTQRTGMFERVIQNCRKIKKAGINLSLRSSIVIETENEMEDMRSIAQELQVPFVCTFEICPTIDCDASPRNHQVGISTILQYEFDDYYNQIKNDVQQSLDKYESVMTRMKSDGVFSCNVGMNSFVIDYEGKMCPCMKLRHRGIDLLKTDFDQIWQRFAYYSQMKASKNYICSNCDSRYYCDICPAEMDMLYGDYEYRDSIMCTLANLRKSFYEKEKSYSEIISEAEKKSV